jgi:ketosteroid isomerase-like protein
MADELGSAIHDQLWSHVQTLNNLWVNGKPDQLNPFFREDVVVLHFDYKTRLRGREAVINSYREFCDESTVHSFQQFKPVIDVFGQTAVVTYAFEIEYEMGDKTYNESGRDMFVFLHEDDQWLVVWRTMLPDPPATTDFADIFVD